MARLARNARAFAGRATPLLALCGWIACDGPSGSGDVTAAGRAPRAVGQAGWEELHTGGAPGQSSPTAGEDAALVHDPVRHCLFLYGGKDDRDVILNELWTFDLQARTWRRIPHAHAAPPPREDHTLVLDTANDRLVLFGGEDGDTSRATWTYDIADDRWTDVTRPGAPALEGHVAIYDPRRLRMVVFGGMRVEEDDRDLEEETWTLELDRASPRHLEWSTLPSARHGPAPRREHDGAYDPVRHRFLVFGGRQRTSSSFLDDVWTLDLGRDAWSEVATHGARPNPIRQSAVGFDPEANELTVFGGEVQTFGSGGDKKERTLPVNQLWVLELETGRWTDRTPYPPPMYDHAGVFVPEYGTTLIYGGSSTGAAKEHSTWIVRKLGTPSPSPAGPR
jgi:hypothetical protein